MITSMVFYIILIVALIIFIEVSELLERDNSNANTILLFGSGVLLALASFVFAASVLAYFTNF